MKDDDPAQPLDQLLAPGDTVMIGTERPSAPAVGSISIGTILDFRPLTVARVHDDCIDILVDGGAEWARRFDPDDRVHVTVAKDRDNTWVSLVANGRLSTDSALIDELWNPMASAYFEDGRDTPDIAAMCITVGDGRYWSSPSGRIGSLVSMVRALAGDPEQSGEHGDVALRD
jgi:hypothetical protein